MSLNRFLYDEAGAYLQVRNAILLMYDPATAIWIAELLFFLRGLLERGLIEDGQDWFYCTQPYITQRTGIDPQVQTKIIKRLVKDGILEVRKETQGTFIHRNLYKINEDNYRSMVHEGEDELTQVYKNDNIDALKNKASVPCSEAIYNKGEIIKTSFSPSEKREDLESLRDSKFEDPFDPYSNKAKQVCLLWNDKYSDVLPKHHVAKTKSFDATMQKIEIALTHYSLDQIDEAMDCYHTLLCMDDLKLNPKIGSHRVGLGDFFGFNEYAKKAIRPNNVVYGIESWFDECLNGIEYLIGKYCIGGVEDEYPEVSAIIKKRWIESPYYIGSLTTWDKNNFKRAAIKLVTWLQKHENKYNLDSMYIDNPKKAVGKYLFPALNNDLGHRDPKMVTTNWLASDSMFERTLHLYLKKLGL